MNRLLELAYFLLEGKMWHREWCFSCTRIGKMQSSELGELPTVFPEYWERKDNLSIKYLPNPNMEFWAAIRDFFGFENLTTEDYLFMWGDGNKKKCKKNGILHQSATREEVADHIIGYLIDCGKLIQY